MSLDTTQIEKISAGSIIQCPSCKTDLYEWTTDIEKGVLPSAKFTKPASDRIPQAQDGDHALCPLCGARYMFDDRMRGAIFHFKDMGWCHG